jgi:hypothetical protein
VKSTSAYLFFWGKEDVFSNWHPSRFTYHGIEFLHVEQFMMYSKAMLFGDRVTASRILQEPSPKRCKDLGREVQGFVDAVWNEKREGIVEVGCREKFLQNTNMLAVLLGTEGKVLVEASPYDRIWGIGLSENDPRAMTTNTWRGLNLLGLILTNIRDQLISGYQSGSLPDRAVMAINQTGFFMSG